MKAAVLYGREDVRVEDVPEKPLQCGEVRVQIEAALTCGTDLKVFRRGYHARMIVPPAVFGHEFAGVISEIHPATADWKIGDRVVAANSAPCGSCPACRRGQENLCDDLLFLNGAYAESIVIPPRLTARNLLPLKPDTRFLDAALTEPLACVVLGIQDLRLQPGESVLILGAGPIGLMFLALALDAGCRVTVGGRGEARLDRARKLGATTAVVVPDSGDLSEVLTASPGGYDVVVEAVGKPEVWETAVRCVRKGGRVNFFGGCPSGTTVPLDTGLLHYSNLTLLASFHHTPATIRRALALIERGVIRSADFVDGETPLDDLPNLLQQMTQGNRAVKTLVRPPSSRNQ